MKIPNVDAHACTTENSMGQIPRSGDFWESDGLLALIQQSGLFASAAVVWTVAMVEFWSEHV